MNKKIWNFQNDDLDGYRTFTQAYQIETLRMCLGDLWKPYQDILISDRYVQAGESCDGLNMAIFTIQGS
jgi:hypothetical protein